MSVVDFNFISNKISREILKRDYEELERCLEVKAAKH